MTSAEPNLSLPTPDFYRYRWAPLAAVEATGAPAAWDELSVSWADGTELRINHCWLQENATGRSVDPVTREGLLDPAELVTTGSIASAAVTSDGALRVAWFDGDDPSLIHPGWLRHIADGVHRPEAWLPKPISWTTASLAEPPTHSFDAMCWPEATTSTDRAWLAFVDDLLTFGLARIVRAPTNRETVELVGSRFGPLRDTNFGLTWDVRADPDPTSVANTSRRLGPHTDLPTREAPPGFQLLHCIENTTAAGLSQMTDGSAVADFLEENEPQHFEALTSLRWVFFNRGETVDHRWSGPIIDLGAPGSPITFRAFYPVRAFPDMDPGDVPRAYAALRRFSELAGDPAFQMTYPFEPGDLVAFDNRRILHGRTAYEGAGHRHLRGCYLDHDDVRSSARVWYRAADHQSRTTTPTNGEVK